MVTTTMMMMMRLWGPGEWAAIENATPRNGGDCCLRSDTGKCLLCAGLNEGEGGLISFVELMN